MKEVYTNFKIKCKNFAHSEKKIILFCIIMTSLLLVSIIINVISDGEVFSQWMTPVRNNIVMDFYNSITVLGRESKTPYIDGPTSYPPLAVFLFYVLGKFVPSNMQNNPVEMRVRSPYSMLYMLFLIIIAIGMLELLRRKGEKSRHQKIYDYFSVVCLFTTGILWNVERGNILFLSLVLLLFYTVYYNSENIVISELALIALAISADIKLYPAIFGLLLVVDKQYKKAVRAVIYGIIGFVIPFFFFEGFEAIPIFFQSLLGISTRGSVITYLGGVSFSGIIKTFCVMFGVECTYIPVAAQNVAYLILLFGCILIFVYEEKWKKECMLTLLLIIVPGLSLEYTLMFLIIPLATFLKCEERSRGDWRYFMVFIMLMCPLPLTKVEYFSELLPLNTRNFTINQFVWQCALIVLFVLLTYDGIYLIMQKQEKKYVWLAGISVIFLLCACLFGGAIVKTKEQQEFLDNEVTSIEEQLDMEKQESEVFIISGSPAKIYRKTDSGIKQKLFDMGEGMELFLQESEYLLFKKDTFERLTQTWKLQVLEMISDQYTLSKEDEKWYVFEKTRENLKEPVEIFAEVTDGIITKGNSYFWCGSVLQYSLFNPSQESINIDFSMQVELNKAIKEKLLHFDIMLNDTSIFEGYESKGNMLKISMILKPGMNVLNIAVDEKEVKYFENIVKYYRSMQPDIKIKGGTEKIYNMEENI